MVEATTSGNFDLGALLKDPQKLKEVPIKTLEELIGEYPYFQTLRLLIAKKLHLENSTDFDVQLKQAAAFAGDRKTLYYLIHPEQEELARQEITTKESPKKEKPKPAARTKPKPQKDSAQEAKPEASEEKLPAPKIRPPAPKAAPKDKVTPKPSYPNDVAASSDRPFGDWLKLYKGPTQKDNKESELQLRQDKENSRQITDFVAQQRARSEAGEALSTPAQKGMGSLEDSEELISETLADIHILQGNLDKARQVYVLLSLKYPEKSAYFAAKIESLKN